MRKVHRYKLDADFDQNKNGSYTTIRNLGERIFLQEGTKTSDRIYQSLQLVDLDKTKLQDACFYRYPKLSLPRMKVDILKEKYNIKITRLIDNADYSIISKKYINSFSDYSWDNIYHVDTIKKFLDTSNLFNDGMKELLRNDMEHMTHNDFISFYFQSYWYGNIQLLADVIDKAHGSYTYIKDSYVSDYADLLNSTNLVTDESLNDFIYEDLHVLTKEEYNSCRSMLKSDDLDNRAMALEMMANCNLNKSFDYVSLLFYFYYDYLKDCKNWNNINVKTLRTALSDFTPLSNSAYGHHYDNYLQQLLKANHLTEFAFKECARYVFHNVVKRSLGMHNESVFTIDLEAIKINPKYIDKIKAEPAFFLSDIDEAMLNF